LHRGLADRAKERPGQWSIPNSLPNQWPATVVEATLRHKAHGLGSREFLTQFARG
jgi:hypothetical protein